MKDARSLSSTALRTALDDARKATLTFSLDLDDAQWLVPIDPAIQPTAWDLGHIAWFAEFWLLRGPHGLRPDGTTRAASTPSFLGPDEHYDSACIAHEDRWRIELHPRAELLDRMAQQLAACQQAIAARADDGDTRYFAHLALFHELMHVEALAWTRALLGYAPPAGVDMPSVEAAERICIPGGSYGLGGDPERGFAFDNEVPGPELEIAPFSIDSRPVRNGDFLRFVVDGGYRRAQFWPGDAGKWLASSKRTMPERWRRGGRKQFEHRWYDAWLELPEDQPVVHVNAYEAEAYCCWAGARLPSAAEWEVAAPRMQWGHTVWEWTSSTFAPYPRFRPGPYTTYSAPWFHHQRELRGGAYTTHPLMHDRRYRNFFRPDRTEVFGGFRTAVDG